MYKDFINDFNINFNIKVEKIYNFIILYFINNCKK